MSRKRSQHKKMKYLLKLFSILNRAKFCSCPKNKIAVFDFRNDILEKMILRDIQFSVIPADFGLLYISFPIIFNFLKNLFRIYFKLKKYRRIFFVYLLSCIQVVRPKVVITVIDNNYLFHTLSQFYNQAEFYAIQNGTRHNIDLEDALQEILKLGITSSMCNFVCFGSHEIESYRKIDYTIYKKFHPVGSLIGSYYWTQAKPSDLRIEFTTCLVSQWRRQIMIGNEYPTLKKTCQVLNNYLLRFINEKKTSCCIAEASNCSEELEYYKSTFGDKAKIIPNNREQFSTYSAMDKSNVIIAFSSTAAYEAFGWGKKVLFCNFYAESGFDRLVGNANSVDSQDYEEFSNKLDYLIKIDDSEYKRLTLNERKYVMNYDFDMPAHKYIRNIITGAL